MLSPFFKAKDKFSKTSTENFSLKHTFEESDKRESSSGRITGSKSKNNKITKQDNKNRKYRATKNLLEYSKNIDKKKKS